MKTKSARIYIVSLFFFIYPILPVYTSIMGINGRNLFCFLFLILTILLTPNITRLKISGPLGSMAILFIWISGRFFQTMVSKSIAEAVYFFLLTAIMYWCVCNCVRQETDFLRCIKAILYGGYLVSILGIIEEITHVNIFSYLNTEYELNYNPLRLGLLRIIGFSQHTIAHGVYVMFCMSLCLYMWQFKKRRVGKVFIICLYALLWTNLVLTLSRSIIICAAISQMLILYLSGPKKFFKILRNVLLLGIPGILVTSIFIPAVANFIKLGFLMIVALFSDYAAKMISPVFGNDNLKGVGNRLDLYKWVAEKMPGHWAFGHGWNAEFSYSFKQSNGVYTWIQIKDSIEVQYLNTLYQYGTFGLVTEILTFISMISVTLKERMKRRDWESQISFNKIAFATFSCYFLEMFAVNQSSDRYIFYCMVMLTLLYNSKVKNHNIVENSEILQV